MIRPVLREWLLRALLLGLSSLFALGVAEVIVRIVYPISDGRDNVTMAGVPITSFFDPGIVYRQLSNEYDAVTTITPEGHRVPGSDGSPDVIFLGDSFTYGWGVKDEDTFAMIYCTTLKLRCANLGMPGTGTAKQLDRLEQFLTKYQWKPREVKLFFFGMSGAWSAGNDFVDNFDERELTATRAGHPIDVPPPSKPSEAPAIGWAERVIGWQSAILGHSNLMRIAKYKWGPIMKSILIPDPGQERMTEALRYTKLSLDRLDAISKREGIAYTIHLIVPVQDVIRGSYGATLATLNGVSPKPAIATAQLYTDSPQQYYFAYDGHLNSAGTRRLGEFLVASATAAEGSAAR